MVSGLVTLECLAFSQGYKVTVGVPGAVPGRWGKGASVSSMPLSGNPSRAPCRLLQHGFSGPRESGPKRGTEATHDMGLALLGGSEG